MNFYEHHIGDYDSHTAHLSWLEDLAYRRLMCIAYRTEKPLPREVPAICRLVRAVSRPEKHAVQVILDEFWELRDDGWHNVRCDEVIAAFQAGEPTRDAKRTNQQIRVQRHREERARLFSDLHARGVAPDWNMPMAQLKALHAEQCATPATAPETLQAVTPATEPVTPATPDATASRAHVPTFPLSTLPLPSDLSPTHTPRGRPLPEPGQTLRLDELLVPQCDRQAMQTWLDHRDAKGKPMAGHEVIQAGKLFAGWGDADAQRATVSRLIANGYVSLRPEDGKGGRPGPAAANGRRPKTAEEVEADYRARGLDPETGEPLHVAG